MSKFWLLLSLIFPYAAIAQSDSVIVTGSVYNSYTGKPENNVPVELLIQYQMSGTTYLSNADGTYTFKAPRSSYYMLLIDGKEYMRKVVSIRDSTDHITREINIRTRSETLQSSTVDSTLIGKTIRRILNDYTLEESDISIISEPPGKIRGFSFELADSALIFILIEKSILGGELFNELKKKKIRGIVIAHPDGTHTTYGSWEWFHTSFYNQYYLDRIREEE